MNGIDILTEEWDYTMEDEQIARAAENDKENESSFNPTQYLTAESGIAAMTTTTVPAPASKISTVKESTFRVHDFDNPGLPKSLLNNVEMQSLGLHGGADHRAGGHSHSGLFDLSITSSIDGQFRNEKISPPRKEISSANLKQDHGSSSDLEEDAPLKQKQEPPQPALKVDMESKSDSLLLLPNSEATNQQLQQQQIPRNESSTIYPDHIDDVLDEDNVEVGDGHTTHISERLARTQASVPSAEPESNNAGRKKIFTIRNMNAGSKAFSAAMSKLGEAYNMKYNELEQKWEGPAEDAEEIFTGSLELRRVDNEGGKAKVTEEELNDLANTTVDHLFVNIDRAMQSLGNIDLQNLDQSMEVRNVKPSSNPILPELERPVETANVAAATQLTPPALLSSQGSANIVKLANVIESITQSENTKKLHELNLSEQNLASLEGLSEVCPRLRHLDISQNKIAYLTGVPVEIEILIANHNSFSNLTSFGRFGSIRHLDISDNNIKDLSCVSHLQNLIELKASRNYISSMWPLRSLSSLQFLELRGNCVNDFSPVNCLRLLKYLDLSNNNITGVVEVTDAISLRALHLDNNQVSGIRFATSIPLRHLCAENNEVNSSSIDLKMLPKLELLNLSGNQMTTVRDIPESLNCLMLLGQKIPCNVTLAGCRLSSLTKADVSGTPILTLDMFCEAKSLECLIARKCNITSITKKPCSHLQILKELDVACNKISTVEHCGRLMQIRRLNLSDNSINHFKSTLQTLRSVSTLSHLDLRGNPITAQLYAPNFNTGADPSTWRKEDKTYEKALADKMSVWILALGESLHHLDGIRISSSERKHSAACVKKVNEAPVVGKQTENYWFLEGNETKVLTSQ
ncbi:hypothetical protein HDU76_004467 [Blyttiomyces sp. JEL0837]|nr:hypothetical protein HDU76_004467 [Blyttiomyces sp. JEL0837]